MPRNWRKQVIVKPWQYLDFEIRHIGRPPKQRFSITENIRVEGGKNIRKWSISLNIENIGEILAALQEGSLASSGDQKNINRTSLPVPRVPVLNEARAFLSYVHSQNPEGIFPPPECPDWDGTLTLPLAKKFWDELLTWAEENDAVPRLKAFVKTFP